MIHLDNYKYQGILYFYQSKFFYYYQSYYNKIYDIAAVVTSSGEKGHALMPEGFNRSRDHQYHHVKDFISDIELKQQMKK